jgi:FtsP/CotA-like multicopper oxidase with cupredoxin domain
MHLHGFFFEIESKGDVALDTALVPEQRRSVVTELMTPGSTMTLRWTPEQAGNWIFHCHMMRHMSAAQRLDRFPGTAGGGVASTIGSHASHAMDEMAGLVIGITVRGGGADARSSPIGSEPRELHLFANERLGVFGDQPGYGFVLQEDDRAPEPDSVTLPGSPLFLTRDEPVEITVTNRLRESLAIHWHGIELESYYDGVAGWSGIEGQIAPAIPPGTSSIVRFTPPRAGTFIYHVHNEAGEELSSGLYGALIVLEPGSAFDPRVDHVFVVGEPGPGGRRGTARSPFVNGTATPAPLQLEVGRAYRLRLISIPADDLYLVSLVRGDAPETWRPLAQDGADLSAEATRSVPAFVALGPGMTFDFEVVPASAGDLSLLLDPINPIGGRPMGIPTRVPIQVR